MRLSGTRAHYRPSPPKMPPGLVELMEGLTKEVLKQSPNDVYGFCASHMQLLLEKRDGPFPKKSLSLEEKVAKAQEKVRQRAKIRRDEYDKALLQQQDSNAAVKDDKQGSTLQVPQFVTAQQPQSLSTGSDKDTVKQSTPNKPIHHEHALERSAEMEISHELGSAISKPANTVIATESAEEKPMKKDDVKESKADAEIVNVDKSKYGEIITDELDSESNKTLQNVSSNVDPETENKQTLELVDMAASNVASESKTNVIDQLKENAEQQINPVNLKHSEKAENIAIEEKDKGLVNIPPENSTIENAVEMTKPLYNDAANLLNSNVSDGFQKETPGKTEDDQVSNNIQQSLKKAGDQIQQSNIVDEILTKDNIKASSIADVQQSSITPNTPTTVGVQKSANDKLKTGEEIKFPNTITGKPQESDNSNIQPVNNPNIVQEVDSDKGNSQIKSDEIVQELNNVPSTEISYLKIESAQPAMNSETNTLLNTSTDILQENDKGDSQHGNNPNNIQKENSDKGYTQIQHGNDSCNVHKDGNDSSNMQKENSDKGNTQIQHGNDSNNMQKENSDKSNTQIPHGNDFNNMQKENSDKGNTPIQEENDSNNMQKENSDKSNTQIPHGNDFNNMQKENSDKGNTPIQEENDSNNMQNENSDKGNTQIQHGNDFNNMHKVNSDKGNTPIQEGNDSNNIQQNDSDKGNSQIKSDEKVQQPNNTSSTEVSSLKIEDPQMANNSESNKPKDVEKLDSIEKFNKPVVETKIEVVSELESRTELPVTGVDRDVPTMVTENLCLKSKTFVTNEKTQHDDKYYVDSKKVISDPHTQQIAKANSSDSNVDFSIPSQSTEEEDTSHDEASANMSDKAEKDNQDGSTMDLETAAITIQKVFRNFLFKSRGSTFEDSANDEGNFLDEDDKNKEECEFPIASALNIDRRVLGITRMDTVLQTVNEEKSLSLSTDDSSTLSSAATIIQAHVRGFLVRNKLNSNKTISTNSLAASNSNEPSITSLEADNDHNKNKTILNIHIVPEGENCFSRDESLITSMDLSLDSSPPSSINLHPLGYDKSERRKQLKREDAIQSISPPSNNSGKLSEDLDSVKELSLNDHDIVGEQLDDHDNNIIKNELAKENRMISPIQNGSLENDVKTKDNNITKNIEDAETRLKQKRKSLTKMSSDEMDVVTPFVSNDDSTSSILISSGEFHDAVLPTRVSRSDTTVVSGE